MHFHAMRTVVTVWPKDYSETMTLLQPDRLETVEAAQELLDADQATWEGDEGDRVTWQVAGPCDCGVVEG